MAKLTVEQLVQHYYKSSDYSMLAYKTKVDYSNCLDLMLNTKLNKHSICTTKADKLTGAMARQSYEVWLKRGIYMANHIVASSRKVYSFGMEMGYVEYNPFSTFKCKVNKPRKIVWTREQITTLLDFCYNDFRYRSIGLIVQMSYEWCQRVGDMRLLKFDNIDFNNKVLNLEQSKRGASVSLPISENLFEMLEEQKMIMTFKNMLHLYQRRLEAHTTPIHFTGYQ